MGSLCLSNIIMS